MSEEIEAIKYLMSNVKIHRIMLRRLYKNKRISETVKENITYQMKEYTRINISLKRMLVTRMKKNLENENNLLEFATNIGKVEDDIYDDLDALKFLKEASKVNKMDFKRVKENYNIKSKTLLKLIDRLTKFEEENLENIDNIKI